jgi:arsenical pump membrane protein
LKAISEIAREVSWSVLPLVAGLFVLVEALNSAGVGRQLGLALQHVATLPAWAATLAASFGVTTVSNILNNLPSGLMTGSAVQSVHVSSQVRDALLIGVDLGPNLSVTGSLATMLWLISIRREGEHVSGWVFLKVGMFIMPPALFFATLALLV